MPLQYRGTLTVSAANTTAVAGLQTLGSAGNLTLTSNPFVLPNGGQRPSLTSVNNLNAVNFTFTGTDRAGNAMSATIPGPNNNTVSVPSTFATISQIAVSAAAAGVSAGYMAQADTNPLPLDQTSDPTNVSITLQNFTGTPTGATVRFTQSLVNWKNNDGSNVNNPSSGVLTYNAANLIWINHATLVNQTAPATGNFSAPVVAAGVFLDGNGGAASVDFIFIQSVKNGG